MSIVLLGVVGVVQIAHLSHFVSWRAFAALRQCIVGLQVFCVQLKFILVQVIVMFESFDCDVNVNAVGRYAVRDLDL